MNADQTLLAHLEQLAASKSPAYARLGKVQDDRLRREAALLLDLLLSEQIAVPSAFPEPVDAVAALRAGVEKARPDRKCIGYILNCYPGWMDAVAPHAREAFLASFPELAPAVHDLNHAGMRLVLEAAANDPAILPHVAAYSMTTADAIRAIAGIAHQAAASRRIDLLQGLTAAFPAAKMEEGKDAEHLLKDLHLLTEATQAFPEALELGIALIERDISAARAACKQTAAVLGKLASNLHAGYLEDFRHILEAIGIRANGQCLRALPDLYRTHSIEGVRQFVALACQAAQSYGALAGEAFLDRRTDAAKLALP